MLLHACINVNEPRPTAFYAIESFGFPPLLPYPAIYRLSGNTQILRQLFRGHFAT
ncbi:Uncharacterised protein [Enterobacter bugandensis]|uniref:Uncharacterized protein n=1 Tax=Enterobacter bugandensis TaxID=881260 RepID=A0A822WZP6_9ENTR|nr:hypothetical protein L465_00970 [Enterobacter sp. BIDMC 29]BBW27899.1 hypothetical protein STN0717ENT56_30550 [Enterobacter bugandensis]CZX94828.1 Uncharacterised protein [Enterobacter bugandensis]SAI46271.1 Uncharacterised protein [Enterobacter bugandensis]